MTESHTSSLGVFIDQHRYWIACALSAGWGAGISFGTQAWGLGWLAYALAFSFVCSVGGRWIRDAA